MARIIKANSTADPPAGEAAALNLNDLAAEARQGVLEARKEAARVVAAARSSAEAVERQAAETGYEEGFARGRGEGLEQGRREGAEAAREAFEAELERLARLGQRIVEELAAARSEFICAAGGGMLEFAIALAEKIVARVAVADIEAARANLRKALELLDGPGEIIVRVNPQQLYGLREHCAKLATVFAAGEVRLVADEQIAPGGVKLTRRQGEIDATVDTQFENVVRALLGPGTTGQEDGRYVAEEPTPPLPFAERRAAVGHGSF